ncbi:unnamed protein product [Heligmosomoides polygyrus]|uniref:Endo/exonuclease/phosphatase domain-containing protein n=1 Tax=Heligmosomoides polygyrus TaxID=6339 RepID=A0A183FMH5_HELPZ|nr:unnamed protein product [Heligmosomoides polygyrus]
MTGRPREVADLMKRRRVEVLCLQETRWEGEKAKEIGEEVKLFYSGEDTKRNVCVDIRVVKTVKSADGRILRKPVEVRKRWEEYFKELLNKEFLRWEVQEEQPTEGLIPSWT